VVPVELSIGPTAAFPEPVCDTLRVLSQLPEKKGVSSLLVLGIDIGGSKLALALADASGQLLRRFRRPIEPTGNAADDVARIADDARGVLAEAGVELSALGAIGVSAPGPVDVERGLLIDPPNLPGWGTVPLVELLGSSLARPIALENDANAAALAEWRFGAGQGCSHLVYLTMSTGIGAGLILDGRLYRGADGNAGEIGHIPLEVDGERCGCGMRGCFEAYAGGAAWSRRLRRTTPPASEVARLAGGREHAGPEQVVAAARLDDPFARAELARYNEHVARGLAIVTFALAPERIILGTIPTAAGDELCLDPIRAQMRSRLWPRFADRTEIVPAALGEALPYLAGVCVALEGAAPEPPLRR
jgi:glucokinase